MYLLPLMCKMDVVFFLMQKSEWNEITLALFSTLPAHMVSIYKWFYSFYLPCYRRIPVPLVAKRLAALRKYCWGSQRPQFMGL